jgi:hypothetical protein
MPLQMTTDCGSETTQVFGLPNALQYVDPPLFESVLCEGKTGSILQRGICPTIFHRGPSTSPFLEKCQEHCHETPICYDDSSGALNV